MSSVPHRRHLGVPYIAIVMLGCAGNASPSKEGGAAQIETAGRAAITLSGWFHTVWGDTPTFLLVDASGRSTTLVVSSELLARHDGPRTLDRRRVTITGAPIAGDAAVRVTNIALDSVR